MPVRKITGSAAALAALLSAGAALADQPMAMMTVTAIDTPITRGDVEDAQQAWGAALVAIATTHATRGADAARAVAEQAIDDLYAYDLGGVLFKPTLASIPQNVRNTREGALAYFVGGDAAFPQDSGFALKGWTAFRVENRAIFMVGDVAKSMGNVHLTDAEGATVVVDKTWAYVRDADGALRITVHHSSLPYAPQSAS